MPSLRDIDEASLVLAGEMFLEGQKAEAIRDAVNELQAELNQDKMISREEVYPLVRLATKQRYFMLTPPERIALQIRLENLFQTPARRVHVANSHAIAPVAATAASLLVRLIQDLGNKREVVHVGLGGGYTSRLVAFHLATQLRAVARLPDLVFHALSTGFNESRPETAPITFFGFFEGLASTVNYVALFAPPFVETDQYKRTIRRLGVKDAFDQRGELDLVVTSLGSRSHKHGDFWEFMHLSGSKGPKVLKKAGWIGDVQYRPYSATGAIVEDTAIRAVSLLELSDLRQMASSADKHVVVVVGPCGNCTKTRSDAVRPLFQEPKLKVWSHFVMDMGTANELLYGPSPREAAGVA